MSSIYFLRFCDSFRSIGRGLGQFVDIFCYYFRFEHVTTRAVQERCHLYQYVTWKLHLCLLTWIGGKKLRTRYVLLFQPTFVHYYRSGWLADPENLKNFEYPESRRWKLLRTLKMRKFYPYKKVKLILSIKLKSNNFANSQ